MLEPQITKDLFIGTTKNINHYIQSQIPADASSIFLLCDANTRKHCFPKMEKLFASYEPFDLIEIEPGELSKNLQVAEEIWKTLKNCNADRKSVLINLGGGVVTDLGGFIASTYMRGIRFIHLPTSLLAMVDAASGGKNGIDFDGAKNMIGTINDPLCVAINIDFIKTLPKREILCGWAEMLKHALIADEKHFKELSEIEELKNINWEDLVTRNQEIKQQIVLKDQFENGDRKKLNFGHTVGHAIEACFLQKKEKMQLTHGEAIAAGMIIAADLSRQYLQLNNKAYNKIERTIDWSYQRITINKTDIKKIMSLLRFDKKAQKGKNKMVLLDKIGHAKIDIEVSNNDIEQAIIRYAKFA